MKLKQTSIISTKTIVCISFLCITFAADDHYQSDEHTDNYDGYDTVVQHLGFCLGL